jgi:cAMP phosphodiesterase
MKTRLLALTLLSLLSLPVRAAPAFEVTVLGSHGGSTENDLSAYLLRAVGQSDYLCLDAGSLLTGLKVAFGTRAAEVLHEHVKAYLISHAHFDHIAGLVLNSPEDTPKPIVGFASTLDTLRDCVFQPRVWANFTNEGPGATGKYSLQRVKPAVPFDLDGFRIEAYPLSHTKDLVSTAFLIFHGQDALLYCGDTGADAVEGKPLLAAVWKRVAPLVDSGHLRAIFLECSYADPRPDNLLFGHLTPKWVLTELHVLQSKLKNPSRMHDLTVAITHIKPLAGNPRARIKDEFDRQNSLGVRFVYPQQGEKLDL